MGTKKDKGTKTLNIKNEIPQKTTEGYAKVNSIRNATTKQRIS